MGMRVAVARHGDQAVDEVGALRSRGIGIGVQRNWFGGVGTSSNGALRSLPVLDRLEWLVRHRRTHPVKPRPAIHAARRGECRAAQLLRVQPMRHFLRRILPARQHAFHRLAGELVAESGLVTQLRLFAGVFVACASCRSCVQPSPTDFLVAPAPFRSIQTAL